MPKYKFKNYQVTISNAGEIKVAPGDSISAYCAALYQCPPKSTKPHWVEFGRKSGDGSVRLLQDPGAITVGETIYHLPSINKKKDAKEVDATLLAGKIERLIALRDAQVKAYEEVHSDLVKQKGRADAFSFKIDMAALIVELYVTRGAGIVEAAMSVDKAVKPLLRQAGRELATGTAENVVSYGDNLSPGSDEPTVLATGKTLLGWFFKVRSLSYWTKVIAGGDGKDQLDIVIAQNKANKKAFLEKIDSSIRQHQAILKQADR